MGENIDMKCLLDKVVVQVHPTSIPHHASQGDQLPGAGATTEVEVVVKEGDDTHSICEVSRNLEYFSIGVSPLPMG